MSMIQSSSALLGFSSALSAGTARFRTVRSIEYSRHGSAMTTSPIHSRRVALGAPLPVSAEWLMGRFRADDHPRRGGQWTPPAGESSTLERVAVFPARLRAFFVE